MSKTSEIDVLVVGAGLSGISMAAHMEMKCPDRSYVVLERRDNLGGTWDLFRYPGVRSDSDMHTLGFKFEPWLHEDAIADGPSILEYLHDTVNKRGITQNIHTGTRVISADWRAAEAVWTVEAEGPDGPRQYRARWLYLASGYYDYDNPHDAKLPGIDSFGGTVIHPQFWPQDLDYSGKKVVVIGSGATAVTIVPAMAETAASVTMLQRTPTWMASGPRRDRIGKFLERTLPESLAYRLTRWKNILFRSYVFRVARKSPDKLADKLRGWLRRDLEHAYEERHFEPPYDPWKQRMCLVPDGDLFDAMKAGKARIETGHIDTFDAGGIVLQSGERLDADIVVTATGLQLQIGGKIKVSRDGVPLDWTDHFFYRNCMFSNVANLSVVFGYLNASWTLRADNNAGYITDVLNHMAQTGSQVVYPLLHAEDEPEALKPFDYESGYLVRAQHIMPKSGPELPWKLNHDYLGDRRDLRQRPVADGTLRFEKLPEKQEQVA
ncbi:flavin-containing monooxygenase [Paraurantiacibacter namhicola]|uniref:FAD-containing monooxygenase EthA n=1 Tax=Paraurantiacibacter namhicola TaxID=645517 RepID=A0A1C7D6V5_9SPHN|nr:NAD(P)/FAD-dependent oxidoreductase [Paraurantiacibacter namhicola]ANU07082.1 FAD-containing monooxygenase EthA [Paraurantiacibacter namhicola]